MMKSSLRFMGGVILTALLALFLTSCGGGGGGSDEGTSLNLTGTWSGNWSSSVTTSDTGSLSSTLTQTGTLISGTVDVTGSPCFTSGSVSGKITDGTVTFTVTSGQSSVAYSAANATSISMNGQYVVKNTGTLCDGDTGDFTLTKQ